MKNNIAIGSKVAYSVQFLRSIGMSHGEMAFARGTVAEVETHGSSFVLARIAWDKNADMPERVNVHNLAIVGPNRKFCNVD